MAGHRMLADDALAARGLRVLCLDETGSTNTEVRTRAEAGEPGPLWIRAERQTAGRGRRGRPWATHPGNLAASLLIRPACTAGTAAQLSYVAALGVAEAIAPYVARERVGLKWPNDVLVGGRKIAGILLESGSSASGALDWLAVGLGLNLAAHPEDTGKPATHLATEAEKGRVLPDPDGMLIALALAFDRWYGLWDLGRGFADIRSAWLACAHGLGKPVTAYLEGGAVTGIFETLDEGGGLVLRLEGGGHRTVLGGEVFFAEPGASAPPPKDE